MEILKNQEILKKIVLKLLLVKLLLHVIITNHTELMILTFLDLLKILLCGMEKKLHLLIIIGIILYFTKFY